MAITSPWTITCRRCLLTAAALIMATAAHVHAAGNQTLTLSVRAQGDTVRAYAAALYDRNNTRIDSVTAPGALTRFVLTTTGVAGSAGARVPDGYWLAQNYPNPFNPSTRIRFQLPHTGSVALQVFDNLGRTVSAYTGELESGIHEFEWSADAAAGVYFYRITAGGFSVTKKMIKLDGGASSGASSLTLVHSAPGTAGAAPDTGDGLRKIAAADYSIRLYNLLATDPQVADTVIQVLMAEHDTLLAVNVNAAPRSIVIPMPSSMRMTEGSFELTSAAAIIVDPASPELSAIGQYCASTLRPATGFPLSVAPGSGTAPRGSILLTIAAADSALGDEGYRLAIAPGSITLSAFRPAGIFHGVQTIRQLLPPAIADSAVHSVAWKIQTGVIEDVPRFAWRGVMQDIARHFFGLEDLKHLIDHYAYYKINRLHLHLTDDAWCIEIKSWPDLAPKGRSPGTVASFGNRSYLTQAQFIELCAYAQSRYVTIIPEIDLPGHFSGALAAYPQLNYNGSYWKNPMFYTILDDVFRELSLISPGRYIHIGGDEAYQIPWSDYAVVVDSVQALVQKYGKLVSGWEEIAHGRLLPGTLVQHWNYPVDYISTPNAIRQGAKAIISRANKLYLDHKYDRTTKLGLNWAGYIEVQDAYNWDPALMLPDLKEADIVGVESPLWSETTAVLSEIQLLAFPRVIGHAEIGWSPMTGRNWEEYKVRLGHQGMRLKAMGVNFYRSQQVPWK